MEHCLAESVPLAVDTNWLIAHGILPMVYCPWYIAHGILPTANRLLRFNIDVDPLCHCGQPEPLLHLFVECPFAKHLVAWYQQLVHRALPQLGCPSASQILVGYKQSVRIPPAFPCLLGIICHRIWSPATVGVLTRPPSRSAPCCRV